MIEEGAEPPARDIGFKRPPAATRFHKGKSGNPKGRPRNRHRQLPYDTLLGQMVTIREDGRERRVTAAEAFMLQLTRKGLSGDSAAARASLAAIETARAALEPDANGPEKIRIVLVGIGLGEVLRPLDFAIKKDALDENLVRWALKPWIVEAALARFGSRRLTADDQREVWNACHKPQTINWPDWWTERG